MDIFIPNLMFLCQILWLGGVCTDDANTEDDADTNDNDAQSMIV